MSKNPQDDLPTTYDESLRYGLRHPEEAIPATLREEDILQRLGDLYASIIRIQSAGDTDEKIAFFHEQAKIITTMVETWAREETDRSVEEADACLQMRNGRLALFWR